MTTKLLFISLLLTGVAAEVAVAGGSSSHEHGQDRPHGKHNPMETDHEEGHQHNSEASAVGRPAAMMSATKIIKVTTLDIMRYKFSPLPDINAGDIVKFVITNKGKVPHEFSVGDENEQTSHREMMRKMPNMTHQDGNTVTINPEMTKVLTWQFNGDSEVVFACNVPGHFEAGMLYKMKIN